MKKIIYTLLLCTTSLSSCLNLEPEMYNVINPGIYPVNEADANSLVVSAAYGTFTSNWYSGMFNTANGIQICSDMTTDLATCQWGESGWGPLYNHIWTPNYNYVSLPYGYSKGFSKMILAEDRIKDVPMPDVNKKWLNAELHLGKGWLGYLLYDYYGPVPVPSMTELSNPLAEIIIPRPTKEWMVNFIETELKASLDLPATYAKADPKYGRFTRGLAYTLLMKLYMHEKEWAKAEAAGRELMKPEYGYDLVHTSYADIFTLENEKNVEIIFACQEDRSVSQQMFHAHVLSSQYLTKNPNIQKWGGFRVPWEFYNTYEEKDKRLEVLVGSFMGTDGVLYDQSTRYTTDVLRMGALPVKYGEDPVAIGEESQVDWVVYRYADVLTLLSEAIVRQEGVTLEAIDLLNRVRTRAGLDAYTMDDIAGTDDFLEKLLLERGHEFFFEGVRRSDLIRHGKYIEYARKRGSVTTKDEFVLMPIPQSVINEGKGIVTQNPGY